MKCNGKGKTKNYPRKYTKNKVFCLTCGKQIFKYNKKYCSRKCVYERNGPRQQHICPNCGKEYTVATKSTQGIYCSHKCYREYFVGLNHPRHGIIMSDELKKKISDGVKKANKKDIHGKLTKILENHPKLVNFIYYVVKPIPDAIAIDFENKKVYAIEMERKNVMRKIENWKVKHDFDDVFIFNENLEEVVQDG